MFKFLEEMSDYASDLDRAGLTKEADLVDKLIALAIDETMTTEEYPARFQITEEERPESSWWSVMPKQKEKFVPANQHMEHPLLPMLESFTMKVYNRCARDYSAQENLKAIEMETRGKGWDAGLEKQRELSKPDESEEKLDFPPPEQEWTDEKVYVTPLVPEANLEVTTKELRDISTLGASLNSRLEPSDMQSIRRTGDALHPSQFYSIMEAAAYKYILSERGAVTKDMATCMSEWLLEPVAIYADFYQENFNQKFQPAEVEMYYMPKLAERLGGN